ncbi:probable S-adenosylmethionine-dependent methyltransferase at5g38780 [Phtheirospermum japonicum]|uniref:Probable S-adenosylmethionine-dependent methyltransferase at5g38780 n=1 Tax=Phtheirospermum japonicum TaxID=374723 RepID=A0A830D9G4_9LAMI|nr:probable S-adenosylmethionine-dependent methyltransferase at5g38780 [Phtheirospermum japonicum]GFQ06399.1 probable S-adenosylmethionine-dependent methyltransferase at5g38780 [Phtheirospermum japonicum]
MNAGDGPQSYIRNSSYQGGTVDVVKPIIQDIIATKLDVVLTNPNVPICIADFGCSTGGNSLPTMQTITQAIKQKLESSSSPTPEFFVFFNDIVANDFNTLFGSLPPDRPYHAVGVPGDFHGRLLPRSSLHFAHSSWSLHWLTQVPRAVTDRDSPAWNGCRVLYTNERKEVHDAYLDQYTRDIERFLGARAVEMVPGGLMALVVSGVAESWNPETEHSVLTNHDVLESCFIDMARMGALSEAKLETFNFPFYYATPQQMKDILESNQSFSIERLEILNNPGIHTILDPAARAAAAKVVSGRLVTDHFGSETITDELYELYAKKLAATPVFKNTDNDKSLVILAVLERKTDY